MSIIEHFHSVMTSIESRMREEQFKVCVCVCVCSAWLDRYCTQQYNQLQMIYSSMYLNISPPTCATR